MAKAAGFTPVGGAEDVGDLVITGDIEIDSGKKRNGGFGKVLAAVALGAAIPLSAAAGYWAANLADKPVLTDTDTANTIRPDDQ